MNNWATSVRLTQILGRKEHRDHHLVNCVVSFSRPSNSDHGGPAKQRICIFPGRVFSSNIWHQGLHIVQWKKLDMLKRWRSTDHLSISTRTCQASLVSTGLLLLHPKQEKNPEWPALWELPKYHAPIYCFLALAQLSCILQFWARLHWTGRELVPECIYLVSNDQTRKEILWTPTPLILRCAPPRCPQHRFLVLPILEATHGAQCVARLDCKLQILFLFSPLFPIIFLPLYSPLGMPRLYL